MSQTIKQLAATLRGSKNEAFRKRNPQVFGSSVGAVEQPQREHSAGAALDRQPQGQHRSQRRVGVVVEIIACRHRLFDDDNSCAGLKPMRDAIARSLGVDDGDKRIRWCYGQCRTDGEEGTIVRVSVTENGGRSGKARMDGNTKP